MMRLFILIALLSFATLFLQGQNDCVYNRAQFQQDKNYLEKVPFFADLFDEKGCLKMDELVLKAHFGYQFGSLKRYFSTQVNRYFWIWFEDKSVIFFEDGGSVSNDDYFRAMNYPCSLQIPKKGGLVRITSGCYWEDFGEMERIE